MTKARTIALKTLKEDNDEGYWQFLMDYIQMSLDFYAQEEFEIEMLLELWKEAVEVKTKMEKNGKLFDSFTDNKTLKHTSMKYEILKRSKRTAETYQAGIDSIKTTYDDARKKNDPNVSALFNVYETYTINFIVQRLRNVYYCTIVIYIIYDGLIPFCACALAILQLFIV